MVAPQGPSVLYILPQVLPVPDWETLSLGTIFCLLKFYVLSSANSANSWLSFHQELELWTAPLYHFTPGNLAKLKIMSLRNTRFTLHLSSVLYPIARRFFLFIPPPASKSAYLFLFFKIFLMWTMFKVFNLLQYCFCLLFQFFFFFFFCQEACEILAP